MGRNHRLIDWNAAATLAWMLYMRLPNVPGSVPIAHHTRV
jgi:hypothetical protein